MTTTDEIKTENVEKQSASRNTGSRHRAEVHPTMTYQMDEDKLAIPESLRSRFSEKGLTLRWIRYRADEREDYQNVSKMYSKGWRFVHPDEVPELVGGTQTLNFGRYKDLVTIEDLALAYNSKANVAKLREMKAEKARRQLRAEDEKLAKFRDIIKDKEHGTKVSKGVRRAVFDANTDE